MPRNTALGPGALIAAGGAGAWPVASLLAQPLLRLRTKGEALSSAFQWNVRVPFTMLRATENVLRLFL